MSGSIVLRQGVQVLLQCERSEYKNFGGCTPAYGLYRADMSLTAVIEKSEHLYSALYGIQATLKRSGMDHTALPAINTIHAVIVIRYGNYCPLSRNFWLFIVCKHLFVHASYEE